MILWDGKQDSGIITTVGFRRMQFVNAVTHRSAVDRLSHQQFVQEEAVRKTGKNWTQRSEVCFDKTV